ncbi:MAG: hypothetical protein LUC90_06530 [Lachnospiraceae bacterium]|nr:hypothetical protein [Lachnospiraceae bacterium]
MGKKEKKTPEVTEEKKVITRYDRKMEERKKAAEKAKKEEKIFRIGCIVAAVLVVVFLAYSLIRPVVVRYAATHNVYITIGDYEFTQQEFDFYTYTAYSEWLESYGDYAALFGLDTSTDISKQDYYDDMTWKDYFELEAADTLIQYVALTDAAQEAGFEYETDTYYDSFVESVAEAAEDNDMTVAAYYKEAYGQYATAEVIEEQIRFCTYASGYYNEIYAGIEVTDEEIVAEYQADPSAYDYVDYRAFALAAEYEDDADEDTIAAAMEEAKAQVEEFVERLSAGEDFNELCLEYCAEDYVSSYEDDGSLSEGLRYSEASSIYADWLFDDSRESGDVEIFENEDSHYYAVAMFIDRYYDTEINDEIYDNLFEEKLSAYIEELIADYSYTFS